MDDDQLMPHLLPTAISVPYDFPTTLDFPLILFISFLHFLSIYSVNIPTARASIPAGRSE